MDLIGAIFVLTFVASSNAATAKVFQIPLKHHRASFQPNQKHKFDENPLRSPHDAQRLYQRAFGGDYFSAEITLGTPPQRFDLIVDMGSRDLWVFDPAFNRSRGQRAYHLNASTSGHFVGPGFFGGNGDASASGDFCEDRMAVGALGVANQTFGLAKKLQLGGDFPRDGLLGLDWWYRGRKDVEKDGTKVPIKNLLDALENKRFSIWIGGYKNQVGDGLLTLGDYDRTHCSSRTVHYIPLASPDAFSIYTVPVESFSVSNYTSEEKTVAILDAGYSLMFMPLAVFRNVQRLLSASFDFRAGLYVVRCDHATRRLDLVFTIARREYHVPAEDYVMDIGLADGKCAVAIGSITHTNFRLGTAFLRNSCVIIDWVAGMIGLAAGK